MADGAKIARFHRTYMLHLLNDLKSRNYGANARVVLLSRTSSTAIKSLVKFQKRYSIVLPQCLMGLQIHWQPLLFLLYPS